MSQQPEELVAFLVAQGCLPMIAGEQPTAAAPNGAPLSPAERNALGFSGAGLAVRYATSGADVLADYGAQVATIQVADTDPARALDVIEKAIRGGLGDTQSAEDAADGKGKRFRTFFVRVSAKRYARVSVSLAAPGIARAPLEVRVAGLAAI